MEKRRKLNIGVQNPISMWDNGSRDCGLWDAGAFLDREQWTRRVWEMAGRGIRLVKTYVSDCVSLGLLSQNQVLDDTSKLMTRRRRDGLLSC
jgi:hypothetical protein